MKTKNKNKDNKQLRLFRKYSQKKEHLTIQQIKKLMRVEFKLVYTKHIMGSFMAIWSTNIRGKQVITKDTFMNKLFKQPDGFFRNIVL
jgi:hypothetical protein